MLHGRRTKLVSEVMDALLLKELMVRGSGNEGESGSGLYVGREWIQGEKGGLGESRSKTNSTEVCYHWKEIGHIGRDCPRKGDGNVVHEDGDIGNGLTVCMVGLAITWIWYTGASHCMKFSRDRFTSFKKWNGWVKMWDDGIWCIKGSGMVQTRLHRVVRRLYCGYVLGLRKNLFSLGTWTRNGYDFSGKGDGRKVSRDARMIMQGRLRSAGTANVPTLERIIDQKKTRYHGWNWNPGASRDAVSVFVARTRR